MQDCIEPRYFYTFYIDILLHSSKKFMIINFLRHSFLNVPPFACLMQLADRIFIIAKGVLFVRIIDISLLWNHSPSEWFSLYNQFLSAAARQRAAI